MIKFYTDTDNSVNELIDVIKQYTDEDIESVCLADRADIAHYHEMQESANGKFLVNRAVFGTEAVELCIPFDQQMEELAPEGCSERTKELAEKKLKKRYAKLCIYRLMKRHYGFGKPWGALTGVRPTMLAYDAIESGEGIDDTFSSLYDVSKPKISLIKSIVKEQNGIRLIDAGAVDLYVGVPFCVTKCTYCSFSGGELRKYAGLVDSYVDCLVKEIKAAKEIAKKKKLRFNCVYIGGGTPTTLNVPQFERVLEAILLEPVEYTVEAGRPDTITQAHLELFKKYGVTRVSVNPQSFCADTLIRVNRLHTVEDIYTKYAMVKGAGFTVNMDLIAGLPSETSEEFYKSVRCAIELSPENITVHTLALKHGSLLKYEDFSADSAEVQKMVDYAYERLTNSGYNPYYLYRQKYASANLENVGYTKRGFASVYNIDMMEETTSVLACGAHSISKKVQGDTIARQADIKDVQLYMSRIDEQIADKKALFDCAEDDGTIN
ncbi:MAG: coproporphyrinogen dehydrogenase HemZ [Clostridia bacterium]|nr:coproporphyrinogen dehydrogenase HemZ [Clostridia bacterium]